MPEPFFIPCNNVSAYFKHCIQEAASGRQCSLEQCMPRFASWEDIYCMHVRCTTIR